MAVKQELGYFIENIKFNIASALEYRTNFMIQTIAMFLNDVILALFWWILFDNFTEMNGWYFKDFLLLMAVVSAGIGFSRALFSDARKLYKKISEGELDYYLVLPKSVLLNSIVKVDYTGIGDIVFGIGLGLFVVDLAKFPFFLLMVLCSVIIYTSFMIIVNSISFYIGRGESLSTSLEIGIIVFSMYPFSLFEGVSRFLLLTILPAGFIGGIPVGLIKNFQIEWFLALTGFTILIALFAYLFFRIGLKRYESGNLTVVRV